MTASSGAAGGVYGAPHDLRALRALFSGPLDLWRRADLAGAGNKQQLLDALARALDFPAHFGGNWDALADSLQDLAWLRWSSLVLELAHADRMSSTAAGDWKIALDILRDAATYWAARGKPFLVLVDGAGTLPKLSA